MEMQGVANQRRTVAPRTRSHKKTILFLIVGLALLGGAWFFFHGHDKGDEKKDGRNQPIPVTLAPVTRQDVPIFLYGIGTVKSPQQVVVRSRVDGELMAVHFTQGQDVTKGQLLAEIDDRTIRAQLAQAVAQRAQNDADLKTARLDYDRYQALLKEDAIAKQTVDQQGAKVAQLAAAVDGARATIDAARVQLTFTKITSPLTGRVGIRRVDVGNIISASDVNGLLTVTQMDPIEVQFSLPQEQLPALLKLPQDTPTPVEAWTKEAGEKLGDGALTVIDNAVDTATGTIRLQAGFPNAARRLWPGQFVSIRLRANVVSNAVVVPTKAIMHGRDGDYAYRVQGDKAEAAAMKLGYQDDTLAVVTEGLEEGDQVVIDGQVRLKPDSTVKVKVNGPDGQPQPGSESEKKHGKK